MGFDHRGPDDRDRALLQVLATRSADGRFTWSDPVDTPWGLTGDRHMGVFAKDAWLVVAFRDQAPDSDTRGHLVAWVGRYDGISRGRPGEWHGKLLRAHKLGDCGYPGLEFLPDGSMMATTYIKYRAGAVQQSVMRTRFTLDETDGLVAAER